MKVRVVKAKPTSPGRRGLIKIINPEIHKGKPHKALLAPKKSKAGRNNLGRITTRHQGGGHKQFYRLIDFKRQKDNIPAKVERLEYDPNRSCLIALVLYKDGERRYILAPKDLHAGDQIISGLDVPIKVGNCLPISNAPLGTVLHNVEMHAGRGGQLGRSAGCSVQLVAKEGDYVTIRLSSGELRKIPANCRATIGEVGNAEHNLETIGKAGRSRWLGKRPTVRGVAMNPVDHPHGGGEGKTSGGRHPVTPWGRPTKGYKTRHKRKSNKFIVRRRKKS